MSRCHDRRASDAESGVSTEPADRRTPSFWSRWLVFLACVTACASTDALLDDAPDDDARGIPEPPPAPDGGFDDAPSEADAQPCPDCEYYPDVCSAETLCVNGPFDSNTAGGGLDPRLTINVIRSRSVSDVWVAGALGTIAHFDGTSWARSETQSDVGSGESLRALWLRDSGEGALATFSRAYTRTLADADAGADASAPTDGWTSRVPSVPAELTRALAAMEIESGWGAPGGTWLWLASTDHANPRRTGLWRVRQLPSNGLEVQAGLTTAYCLGNHCTRMRSIHGASADVLWAVGESGSTVRITGADGDAPSGQTFNSQAWHALNGVWASSPTDVWAVGANGTIRHYTGDPMLWDVVTDVPTQEDLKAVWGSSPTDVWAVGEGAVVLHYDGTSWSRVKIAGLGSRRPNLTTVWVAAPGHVWVGGRGVMLSLGGKP